jgi:hypothetical protein
MGGAGPASLSLKVLSLLTPLPVKLKSAALTLLPNV